MRNITDWFQFTLEGTQNIQHKVFTSLIIIVLFWLFRAVLLRILFQKYEDVGIQYRWRKSTAYIAFAFAALLVGRVWFEGVQSLSTFLGLLSAGLAIALHEPLVNLAGWAFIIWRRPFNVGDRIQIGEHAGDVIDQRIFMFSLMEIRNWIDADQSTGRVIHVPNGKIFRDVLANFSSGFQYIWNEIPVLLTFESDWKKAKEILLQIVVKHAESLGEAAEEKLRQSARRYMIFYSKLTPTVYTCVKDCGVLLTLRFLCEPRRRRGIEQEIWEDILNAFAEHDDIDFAYPTQRFYNNFVEGKPGTKPGAAMAPDE